MPTPRVAWSDQRIRSGWLIICLAGLLYLAFLPSVIVNADEFHYAGQAYAIAHGRLVPSATDPVAVVAGKEREGLRFPLGWPIALALARPFGFRAMYLVPMLFHLAAGIAFARLAVRRGLPAWTNVLYVLHPVAWGLSRTIMSDVPAVALLVMAIDSWESGRSWLSGALLAGGGLLRLGGFVSAAGFGLATMNDWTRRPRMLAGLILPIGIAGLFQAIGSRITTGTVLGSYFDRAVPLLDGSRIGEQVLLYAAGLAVIPPFPLLNLVVRPRSCDRWGFGSIPVLVFFVAYSYHDESPRLIETLVGGQRFVLAASAFLLIGTLMTWGHVVERLRLPIIAVAFGVAITAAFGLDRIRRPYEQVARAVASCRPEHVGSDYDASKVVAGLDVKAWHFLDGTDPMGKDDLVVIARQVATNRISSPDALPRPPELGSYVDRCQRVGRFEIYDLASRCGQIGERCR